LPSPPAAGDSQGIIVVEKSGAPVHGIISGAPHKPTDKKEAKRIKEAKGMRALLQLLDGRVVDGVAPKGRPESGGRRPPPP